MGVVELMVIFGPPAVGKMAVGHEVCRRTGFVLLHNHLLMEPLLGIFPYGSEPFGRLSGEFRRRVLEEAAEARLPGVVFTFVWGLELPEDARLVESYTRIAGGPVSFVELEADLDERLRRNATEFRLERKPSKRDLAASREGLLRLERYAMNTDGRTCAEARDLLDRHAHLKLDNTHLSPEAAADLIVGVTRGPAAGGPPG
ncbi:hypothetical protein ACPZ19_31030 [Amycolatopsis lurida]